MIYARTFLAFKKSNGTIVAYTTFVNGRLLLRRLPSMSFEIFISIFIVSVRAKVKNYTAGVLMVCGSYSDFKTRLHPLYIQDIFLLYNINTAMKTVLPRKYVGRAIWQRNR